MKILNVSSPDNSIWFSIFFFFFKYNIYDQITLLFFSLKKRKKEKKTYHICEENISLFQHQKKQRENSRTMDHLTVSE